MSQVKVILPGGEMVAVTSNQHDADALSKVIVSRQKIAEDYCSKMGWPADPTQLSFYQIFEIRKQQNWIDAGE